MAARYRDCSLDRFAELVAAREPAPGGGPVAAVTASLAAALVTMAARYSEGVGPGVDLVQAAERLSSRAADLADEDAVAYQAVIDAYASTRRVDRTLRRQLIRAPMQRAAEVALEIAELAAETATLAAKLAAEGTRSVRGDVVTAVILAEAVARSAAYLVAVDVEAGGCDEKLVRSAQRCVETARAASSSIPPAPSSPR